MNNISKSFPGVKALDGVDFELKKGEVHALCGENGAGKTTLVNILNGIYRKDTGIINIDGQEVDFKNIGEAKQMGLGLIPQEIEVIPDLNIAENIFISNYPRRWKFFVDWKKINNGTKELQKRLGESALAMGTKDKAGAISMGKQQLIEIMRTISLELKILAFDEPTSSLSEEESEHLFKIIKELSEKGIAIVYISHKLKEIFSICDRVTVLKDGKYIGTEEIKSTDTNNVIRMMVGRDIGLFSRKEIKDKEDREVVLEVKGLKNRMLKDISFKLKKGEILGMFGIVGSGRTEIARAIFGLDRKDGEIIIKGRSVAINSPRKAVEENIGFVTEDRHKEGLVLITSVRNNITMPFIKRMLKYGFINHKNEKKTALKYIKMLDIKTPSDLTLAENLSGGNQQKIVIAKWLGTQSEILIFDEPTRGIDVATKLEIYKIILRLSQEGKSIILISSEMPEILALSDRVLVFKEGKLMTELENSKDLKEEDIINYAVM